MLSLEQSFGGGIKIHKSARFVLFVIVLVLFSGSFLISTTGIASNQSLSINSFPNSFSINSITGTSVFKVENFTYGTQGNDAGYSIVDFINNSFILAGNVSTNNGDFWISRI